MLIAASAWTGAEEEGRCLNAGATPRDAHYCCSSPKSVLSLSSICVDCDCRSLKFALVWCVSLWSRCAWWRSVEEPVSLSINKEYFKLQHSEIWLCHCVVIFHKTAVSQSKVKRATKSLIALLIGCVQFTTDLAKQSIQICHHLPKDGGNICSSCLIILSESLLTSKLQIN